MENHVGRLQTMEMWVLEFDNGHQAHAINAPWFSWKTKLRAWITMDFGHFAWYVDGWSWLYAMNGGNALVNEGRLRWFHVCV